MTLNPENDLDIPNMSLYTDNEVAKKYGNSSQGQMSRSNIITF